jgi:hypothetical protein
MVKLRTKKRRVLNRLKLRVSNTAREESKNEELMAFIAYIKRTTGKTEYTKHFS